jgi:hypothetical protein
MRSSDGMCRVWVACRADAGRCMGAMSGVAVARGTLRRMSTRNAAPIADGQAGKCRCDDANPLHTPFSPMPRTVIADHAGSASPTL